MKSNLLRNQLRNQRSERFPQAFRILLAVVLLLCVGVSDVAAQTQGSYATPQTRLVVRDSLGLGGVLNLCGLLGCSSVNSLGDPQGQLFMIQIPSALAPLTSLLNL